VTLVSDIITRAYRESQLIPLVQSPNTNEQNEALPLLTSLFLACVAFETGEELGEINIGGNYDQSICVSPWIPDNARLILNLSGTQTLKLDPMPYEGQRLAFADAGNNLATYNLTLDGNGRTIEGATSLTLSTNGDARQWIYRSDTANWTKITSLQLTDTMPFPVEYDDYFIIGLAMRLNPRNGAATAKESVATYQSVGAALRARYRKPRRPNEPLLGLLHQRRGFYSESNTAFNFGRP
jgi:hypothetical protein